MIPWLKYKITFNKQEIKENFKISFQKEVWSHITLNKANMGNILESPISFWKQLVKQYTDLMMMYKASLNLLWNTLSYRII